MVVWDKAEEAKNSTFLGEVLLDLKDALIVNMPMWYPLASHDENIGPLPRPDIIPDVGRTESTESDKAGVGDEKPEEGPAGGDEDSACCSQLCKSYCIPIFCVLHSAL